MEKTFSLDQREQQVVSTMEQEHLRLSARYGQLCREKEDLDKRLGASEEQQRAFIRHALASRNVDQFDAAQVVQGNQLVCRIADMPQITVNEGIKANGKPQADIA